MTFDSFARPCFHVGPAREGSVRPEASSFGFGYAVCRGATNSLLEESPGVPFAGEALEFTCVLATAAAKGDAQEVQWLVDHTPAGYSPHVQQGANLALFASITAGQHAACQLLLEWCNPNKEPMELPMCTFSGDGVCRADVSLLGLAYEWRRIQGQKGMGKPGHSRQLTAQDYHASAPPGYELPLTQYLGLLRLLLEFNASPAKGVEGLFQAVALSSDTTAVHQLLQRGLDANAALSDGNTLLHLLVMGPDTGFFDTHQDKAVQARSRQIEAAVRFLIQKGANPLARNNQWKTPVDVCFPLFSSKSLLLDALEPRVPVVQQHISTGLAVCSICMHRPSVMVLVPCGHLCICQECSHYAQQRCPICRTATTNIVKTYVS